MFAHFARKVGQDLMPVIQANAELGRGQGFDHRTFDANFFLLPLP